MLYLCAHAHPAALLPESVPLHSDLTLLLFLMSNPLGQNASSLGNSPAPARGGWFALGQQHEWCSSKLDGDLAGMTDHSKEVRV